MNFSSVPRTSSTVEEDGTCAEYRMSRNCAREPDAKRSYIRMGVPYFNNGVRVVEESETRRTSITRSEYPYIFSSSPYI